ncbi:hypothetical protein CMMCA001_07050 [Clavibacter michiganensis subsp. michiganensis]|nr:hypothetical protein CMMCA001_07050 [Clavibacter michiganensis subsp. michiganensis]
MSVVKSWTAGVTRLRRIRRYWNTTTGDPASRATTTLIASADAAGTLNT